jgi:hypothetical protein
MLPSCPGKPSILLSRAKQGAILPSSRTDPPFVSPSPLLIFPSLPCRPKPHSCRPERFFLSTRAKRGVPRLLRTLGLRWQVVAPSASEGSPPVRRRTERCEGYLAIAQQDRMEGHDRMVDVAPSPLSLCRPEPPFVSPRRQPRGLLLKVQCSSNRNSKSILRNISNPVL